MAEQEYIYGVARVRAKEMSLLNNQAIEQLISAQNDDGVRMLEERGWESKETVEELIAAERARMWKFIGEIVDDLSVFDVFLYKNDFHNLKAAIKMICGGVRREHVLIDNGAISRISPEKILKCCEEGDFSSLPENMRDAARKAYTVYLETSDSQLSDMLIDKAALEAIVAAGDASNSEVIRDYAELVCATSDIKTALRCAALKKPVSFIREVLARCKTVNAENLAKAAAASVDAVYQYLEKTEYGQAVDIAKTSFSAFERWCDDLLTEKIRPQKYRSFTVGPIAAYILAKENELKTVRVILLCKKNQIPEEKIRERVRVMYV